MAYWVLPFKVWIFRFTC